ncbi:hypothetical protein [Nostoc sp. TCL26-01]|uniref:hypothetical protein n=1 Tax=Nostoc sp. TCL26-01 TaxID=2576904 RepID=UPI0015B90769|nr:hypothetical protein [Nostoc sp. TCL26-01]QLE54509.1 hypothetical protein FD725_02655 [Nostoc sp. TCL26-01]
MPNPDGVQIGDRVLILSPGYIAGEFGVVCGRESRSDGQPSKRWLIKIDSEKDNIVVSLLSGEFQIISSELE